MEIYTFPPLFEFKCIYLFMHDAMKNVPLGRDEEGLETPSLR